ncbi:unnamed protein product [Timema podura]|uniref:Uncharacterized protein n=1 Tax=Timema podura TaxID=61482 RepID=A0ABN7NLF8_TIMPD|nr:unnamed protein product [Timema podura]
MFVFNRRITMFGIAEENLFNAPIAWKKVLHSAIKEGIKSGIIQPLEKIVFPEQQTLEALRELSKCHRVEKVLINFMEKNKTNLKHKSVLNMSDATTKALDDIKNSHIIIGSEIEDCLCLAEWLVTHKANKITIASKSQKLSVLSERRMFLLRRYHNAHIIQTSSREDPHTSWGKELNQECFKPWNSDYNIFNSTVRARLIPLKAQMVPHTSRVTPGLYHALLLPHMVRITTRNTHCCSHVVYESISVTQLSPSLACYSLLRYLPPKDTFLSHSCHP